MIVRLLPSHCPIRGRIRGVLSRKGKITRRRGIEKTKENEFVPCATTCPPAPHPVRVAHHAVIWGGVIIQNVVARGGWVDVGGPCGCQVACHNDASIGFPSAHSQCVGERDQPRPSYNEGQQSAHHYMIARSGSGKGHHYFTHQSEYDSYCLYGLLPICWARCWLSCICASGVMGVGGGAAYL
jgi:hypothetical protein